MSDFVPETGKVSLCVSTDAAGDVECALGELRESSLQSCLATLEATVWAAETGAGSAAAAIEMARLARQMRDQTAALIGQLGDVYH